MPAVGLCILFGVGLLMVVGMLRFGVVTVVMVMVMVMVMTSMILVSATFKCQRRNTFCRHDLRPFIACCLLQAWQPGLELQTIDHQQLRVSQSLCITGTRLKRMGIPIG